MTKISERRSVTVGVDLGGGRLEVTGGGDSWDRLGWGFDLGHG